MKPHSPHDDPTTLAKTLAPEDVRRGDYVAVLDTEYEFPKIVWQCDSGAWGESQVIRVRLRPREGEPLLRVYEVCVPFVFVEPPNGAPSTIDLRSSRIARLDPDCAVRVWKRMRKTGGKRSKTKQGRKRST